MTSFNTPAAQKAPTEASDTDGERGDPQGLAPAYLSHLKKFHSPSPTPILFRHLGFLAVPQICQTRFCLEDFYLLFPQQVSFPRDLDK